MSRHRNIRSMNYSEECDGYDDVYGHSVEEDYCISPSDAAQFMYDREGRNRSMGAFFKAEGTIAEDDESEVRLDTDDDIDKVKLESCVASMKNALGDTIPMQNLIDSAIKNNYDTEKAIDDILSNNTSERISPPKITKDFNKELKERNSSSLASLIEHHKELKMKQPLKFGLGKKINFSKKIIAQNEMDCDQSCENKPSSTLDTFQNNFENDNVSRNSKDEFNNFESNNESLAGLVKSHLRKNTDITPKNIFTKNLFNSPSNDLSNIKTSFSEKLESNKVQNDEQIPTSLSCQNISIENPNWTIDLTQALIPHKSIPKVQADEIKVVDDFVPEFVDCEIPTELDIKKDTEIFKTCCLDIKDIYRNVFIDRKRCSNFGKVICKKYIRKIPSVEHSYQKISVLVPFNFATPSPDDKIKAVFKSINRQ